MNRGIIIGTIIFIAFFWSCRDEKVEECPCFAETQNPIYKGCSDGTIYDLENDCEPVGKLIEQLYDVIEYPPEARADSIQGTVITTFDIYEDGSIGNIQALNDTLGYGLAEAAIAAVSTLNDKGFCPARENCSPVVFHYTLPIRFVIF